MEILLSIHIKNTKLSISCQCPSVWADFTFADGFVNIIFVAFTCRLNCGKIYQSI